MARKSREPTIERREHRCADGSVTEYWSVRYFDPTGTRRRLRCGSREEAEFRRAQIVFEGVPTAPAAGAASAEEGAMTLAEFWPVWAADARERLARSTMREYQRLWERRLSPQVADRALGTIKPRDVSAWRSELLASGVGPEATRYAMVLLPSIFSIAIEWGEASANPVSVVRKPRQGRRKAVRPLPPEDVERLRADLVAHNDHRSATLISVLAYAGLRPGEALALQWRHVRERTLLVEQAVSDGELKLQKTGRVYRTVDLLDALAEDLREWGAPRRRRRHSSSRAPTDIHGARTTGTTGATGSSARQHRAWDSDVPGRMTCATRSPRFSSASNARPSSSSLSSSVTLRR